MSERSFRDPSPSRSAAPVPPAADAPPVPALPKSMPTGQVRSARRTASMDVGGRFQSASLQKPSGRGSSVGPGSYTTPRSLHSRNSSLASTQELTSPERPMSPGSVNFSLPTSTRPMSPDGQRPLTFNARSRSQPPRITSPTNQNLVYDPNTRSFRPFAEVLAFEQTLRDAELQVLTAAHAPQKRAPSADRAGTHLAQGSMPGRPKGTAVQSMEEQRRSQSLQPAARM